MRAFIVLSAIVACAVANPGYLGGYVAAPTAYNSVGYSAPTVYNSVGYSAPAITTYAAPAVATYAAAVPVAVSSQYQAQDTIGQYSYGYNDLLSAKSESRAVDGSVAGAYSYVDGKGEVQKVQYTADSTGFHVAASNLPVAPKSAPLVAPKPVQDTPEVTEARARHLSAVEEVKNRKVEVAAPVVAPVVAPIAARVAYSAPLVSAYSAPAVSGYAYSAPAVSGYAYSAPAVSGYAYSGPAVSGYTAVRSAAYAAPLAVAAPGVSGYAYSAPAYTAVKSAVYGAPAIAYSSPIAYSAPVAVAAPVAVSNQYHAQDILGQYSYGYNGVLSAKAESKSFDGITRGGYSYVDANGLVQKVDYTADDVNGFRVAATNLPVGPNPVAASTIPETAEVVAAKSAHFAAHVEAKQRLAKAL